MAVDARETAAATVCCSPRPTGPTSLAVVDYVVRQYPPPGVKVPRGAVVTVWFEFGEGEGGGGAGVRGPVCRGRAGAGWSASSDRAHRADSFAANQCLA